MTNWLADPATCAIKAIKGGCRILTGRDEVMSRSTRAVRTEERGEVRWSWGHLAAVRDSHGIRLNVANEGGNLSTSSPPLSSQHATVASDLLRAAAVDAGGQACGGKTIMEMLWEELDSIMERLMTDQPAEDERDPGRAEGVAYAIALMQNPYQPNIDHVRMQAMARWEEQQEAEPTPTAPAARRRRPRRAR